MITFFFSSRRRHTRLQGDWSSDVCSSDLVAAACFLMASTSMVLAPVLATSAWPAAAFASTLTSRSEERRVGKECSTGLSTDAESKKSNKTTKVRPVLCAITREEQLIQKHA